jgi:hypothetical protein
MVNPKANRHFLAKTHEFSEGKLTPERHRSGVVHSTFRHRSDVVQNTVQVGSTGRIVSPPKFTAGHIGCSQSAPHYRASCEFPSKPSQKLFWGIFGPGKETT